ncbi:MAG: tetratricopeptide repeat protein [Chloroflexota bacterium]
MSIQSVPLSPPDPPNPPTGTVTFLFTDIEGSTKRWEHAPAAMQAAHSTHEAILRKAIAVNNGYAYKMIGDAFQVAFSTASQALQAAIDAQVALHQQMWPDGAHIRVRMALHTGVTEERGDDYVGPALNRVARLLSAGHGGQVLISLAAQQLLRDTLPAEVTLRDMGSHHLKDLTEPEHVFQLVDRDLPSEFPPLKSLEGYPNNLPVQTTPFIGRERELGLVRSMLLQKDMRLLTLTGPGGTGRTRLALQVAADLVGAEEFEDGVFFVDLSSITDPAVVVSEIAHTLGVQEVAGQPIGDTLKEYLKNKRMLLLVDNFEQVLEAAPQISHLLRAASYVKVFVTSRAALHLSMEYEYSVPPLTLPNLEQLSSVQALIQNEAVALFVQRAQAVKSDFSLTEENALAVMSICRHLDGLPLAIVLAASRIKGLGSPQAILSRLGSRLKLLTGGATDLPTRQQTLRNTIEWSYSLLTAGEKKLFRRLAVFRGGRTLDAAEAVCNANADLAVDVLDGITSLVDKSLMYSVEGMGSEPRYMMLETIFEYAWEKLEESGESAAIRREHALYFMKMTEAAESQLREAGQTTWLQQLESEHENLRAALRLGLNESNSLAVSLHLAGALYRFWLVRGYFTEGREQLAALLSRAQASSLAAPSDELASAMAKALLRIGGLAWAQGDYDVAHRDLQASLELYRSLGDKRGIARSLLNLGNVDYYRADRASARGFYEESLGIYRELSDKHGIATALLNLGNVDFYDEMYPQARSLMEESLVIRRALGDKQGVAQTLHSLADVALYQHDYEVAQALYKESLDLRRDLKDSWGIVECLEGLALVTVQALGPAQAKSNVTAQADLDVVHAARLWGAAEALRETIGTPRPPAELAGYELILNSTRAHVDQPTWQMAWSEGRAMSLQDAIAYAHGPHTR